jgi:hypothetical protein
MKNSNTPGAGTVIGVRTMRPCLAHAGLLPVDEDRNLKKQHLPAFALATIAMATSVGRTSEPRDQPDNSRQTVP